MSVNSHPGSHAAPRKRPVQARSRATVDVILDAAAHVFESRGYTATTTNHVAAAADVSVGSIYQYFPNKDALIVALEERHLEHVRVALTDMVSRWRKQEPAPAEWAADLVDTLITANDSALHVLIYDTAPPLPHLVELTNSVVAPLIDAVARQLRRWHHGPRARVRAEVLVVTALRLVHDLAIRTRNDGRRARLRAEVIRTVLAIATNPAPSPPRTGPVDGKDDQ